MEGVITEEDDKCCQTLIDMMTSGDFDSITIEDINRVLFHIVNTSLSISTSKLEAIFGAAAEKGKSAERKLQEGKSIPNVNGVIPGFTVFEERSIQILLNGIDLENERYNTHSGSALHFALETKNHSLVEYLIEQGYPLYKENSDGLTPLDTVCKYDLDLTILLKANVDINHVSSKGFESIYYAFKSQNLRIAKELMKFGGDRYERDYRLLAAVEAGNLEMIKHDLQDPRFYPIEGITDKIMTLAIARGSTLIMEILIEKGFKIQDSSLLKIAIFNEQLSSLLLLLQNKQEIDIVDLNSLYPFDLLSDKEALITLPSLLECCGAIELNIINEFIEKLIIRNYYRCMKVFLEYLSISRNKSDIMTDSLLSASRNKRDSGRNLLELAGLRAEDTFMVLIDFIDINDINDINDRDDRNHRIYHILLYEKKYRCLKKLFDKTVLKKKGEVFFIDISFINSIEKTKDHVYSKDHDDSISPTFLHKLNNCKDSKIKFHPVVSAVVERKLAKYRLWYILTFVLYCIFLSSLYFALFNASYQCDDALFSYTGSFGALRAVCEVVVLIYGILFSVDEGMEFAIIFIRFSRTNFETKNIFKALLNKDRGKFKNFTIFRKNLTSLLRTYFGILNIIDNLGLVFLFLLIIFRLSSSHFQWTLASFTIILFTLRLFKYTRNNPSLGAYVKSIFKIFEHDIIQFSVIVLIIMLAYFGGIHLAARQTYVSPDSTTTVPSDNCSNNSFTGLFWFDRERTSSYDLRRPLLSGVIFLLDGGPGNEEIELLNSNFLFSLLYLGFAFTLIVVMSNILIAQLSQTYAKVTKNAFLPFKFDLVVSVEYDSNLAFFFGKYLRKYNLTSRWVRFNPEDWKDFFEVDLQAEILDKLEDYSNVLNDQMEKNQKDTEVALEFQENSFSSDICDVKENIRSVKEDISGVKEDIRGVQEEIGIMKQDVKKEIEYMKQDVRKEIGGVKESIGEVKLDFEKRMEHMEGMMNKVLSLLEQSTPTAATL